MIRLSSKYVKVWRRNSDVFLKLWHSEAPGFIAEIEADVESDLIVPAPSRMEFTACLSNPVDKGFFDGHVDILIIGMEGESSRIHVAEDRLEARDDRSRLSLLDNPLFGEHSGMGDAAGDVKAVQTSVVVE